MPLALPQSYSTGRVIRIPVAPQTVGDHLRRRRLGLKMLQREVAEQLGVCEPSICNWEANTSAPEIRHLPGIIRLLGYNPLPVANTLAERLVRQRTSLGLSQKQSAERLGVDPSTLARWERGEREPTGAFAERVQRYVKAPEVTSLPVAALTA
jgi:transcriptional regulator with XRE-family HTH domain